MKKRLIGGLIAAGALTVWSTAALLADDTTKTRLPLGIASFGSTA